MSYSTIFELSLEEETENLFQQIKKEDTHLIKNFKRIIERHISEKEELRKSIKFFQNNYHTHKQIIQDLKSEIRRLNGVLFDCEVPDIDQRPSNPSPPDTDTD